MEIKMRAGLGFNANQLSWPVMAGEFSEPDIEERQTLGPVDREEANLEAEVGETAVTNLNADGIPEQYKIGGKRHYDGGTPLNLPDKSYIFSRDKSMKIKDAKILEQFGITNPPPGGVTPADIAKKYNLNKYKKILLDKDADETEKATAEMMISNYTIKLGKLALIQESMKGFPEGIPFICAPYLESVNLDPEEILPKMNQIEQGVQANPEEPAGDMAKYGRSVNDLKKHQVAPGQVRYEKDSAGNYYVIAPNGTILFGDQAKNYKLPSPVAGATTFGELAQKEGWQIAGYNNQSAPGAPGYTPPANSKPAPKQKSASAAGGLLNNPKITIAPPLTNPSNTTYHVALSEESNQSFQRLKEGFNDPEVKARLQEKFKEKIEDLRAKNQISQQEYGKLLDVAKDPNMTVDYWLRYQRQNYAIQDLRDKVLAESGIDIMSKQYGWDGNSFNGFVTDANGKTVNKMHAALLKKLGFDDNEVLLDVTDTKATQALTFVVDEMGQSPEFKQKFQDAGFVWDSRGGYHEDAENVLDTKTGKKTWSPVDGRAGDNTTRVTMGRKRPKPPGKIPQTCLCDGKEIPLDANGDCPCPGQITKKTFETNEKRQLDKEWWLQDVVRFAGAVGDYYRVKKYNPWQAVPAVDYIEPTFYSPERELAANAEQLSIGAQGAAQFADAQSYNARFSQMAGKAATNAADVLGRYNNLNVGVANDAMEKNVKIFNEYADDRAEDATLLYDKVTAVNQEFDNSKNKARQQMRQSYIDAVTNAAQGETLNWLYPNFAVDRGSGGYPAFTGGWGQPTPTKPTKSNAQQIFDELKALNMPADKIWDVIGRQYGVEDKQAYDTQKEEKKLIGYGSMQNKKAT